MILHVISPKHGYFSRYSCKVQHSGHILTKQRNFMSYFISSQIRKEIQYLKYLSQIFGLEFFIFKNFVGFFHKKHQVFQFMKQAPANIIIL